MLVEREVDYVTAIISSFNAVTDNARVMYAWGAVVGVALLGAMVPLYLGLIVVLPVLGHTTWHLYRAAVV